MCIRDRVRSVPGGVPQVGVAGFMVADARVAGRVEGQRGVPVSYTHLRAHETVLDLVCRLLLEKKNTRLR